MKREPAGWCRRERALPVTVVLLGALITSACGSTVVQPPGSNADAQSPIADSREMREAQDGLAGTFDTGAPGSSAATNLPEPHLGAAQAVTGQARPQGGGRASAGESYDASRATPNPPGVTDTEIHVGIQIVEGYEAAAAAFGAQVGTLGDQEAYYRAYIDDVNARGGVQGRKLVPHFHGYNLAGDDVAVQEQAMCERFVRDERMYAVLAFSFQTDTLRSCLERAGVVNLGTPWQTGGDRETFRRFPHYAEAGTLNLSRQAAAHVDGLAAQDFFGQEPTIGMLLFDLPAFVRTADEVLKPALAAHGLQVAEEARVTKPYQASQLAEENAQIQNAVLRFRAAGVDRVLFLENDANIAWLFMSNAESQGYRPRYGLSSSDGPNFLVDNVPAAQLRGSMGVGWFPRSDVPEAQWPPNARADACLQVLNERDISSPPDPQAERIALGACDHVTVFATALATGSTLTADGFIGGFEGLSDSLPSSTTFAVRFGPGRRDGVAAIRHFQFVEDCMCFRYTSQPLAI